MFVCAITKRCSRPGVKPIRLVVEKRAKEYFRTYKDEETGKINTIKVADGWEVKREINVSEEGLRIWQETHPVEPKVEEEKLSLKHRVMVPNRMGDQS